MKKIKLIIVACILTALVVLPLYNVDSTPTYVGNEAFSGQTVSFTFGYTGIGAVSDTMQIMGYAAKDTPINSFIVVIAVTDIVTTAGVTIEGCIADTGVFFNLRADGVEVLAADDTLVYRYEGVTNLRLLRLHFAEGDSAIVGGIIMFGK